jgi:ABC-type transporter MlaC component
MTGTLVVPAKPLWKQLLFWVAIFQLVLGGAVLVAVVISTASNSRSAQAQTNSTKALERAASIAKDQAQEAKDRAQQLRDVICGVYVPIASAHLSGANSDLGKTIVIATRRGALQINCPGLK